MGISDGFRELYRHSRSQGLDAATAHRGSKRGYRHRGSAPERPVTMAPGQRVLPPHAKPGRTGQASRPMTASERRERYLAQTGCLTPRQARRIEHKLNRALTRAGQYVPEWAEQPPAGAAEPAAITARSTLRGQAQQPAQVTWAKSALAKLRRRG
jgi:hypothetical protein